MVIVQRRLDDSYSGSAVYLLELVRALSAAGLSVAFLIAPRRGFGSRPWLRIDQAFLAESDRIVWPGAVRLGGLFVSTSLWVWRRGAYRVLRGFFTALLGGSPNLRSPLGSEVGAREAAALTATLRARPADVLVAEYSSLAPVLERTPARVRAVLLHDLFSMRAAEFSTRGLAPDHAVVTLEAEAERMAHVNLCLHASQHELDALRPLLPQARHVLLRPPIKRENTGPISPAGAQPPRCVFIGVDHGGNADALRHLLQDLWPEIHAAKPDAELQVVGSITPPANAPPGVVFRGRIDDLAEIGGADSIGLAPMRIQSGVSIKIATYMDLGMPIVTLRSALIGYGGRLDDALQVVDDAPSFVRGVVDLLACPEKRGALSARAKQAAKTRFSNDEATDAVSALLCEEAQTDPTSRPINAAR